jgi:hypothetical protein
MAAQQAAQQQARQAVQQQARKQAQQQARQAAKQQAREQAADKARTEAADKARVDAAVWGVEAVPVVPTPPVIWPIVCWTMRAAWSRLLNAWLRLLIWFFTSTGPQPIMAVLVDGHAAAVAALHRRAGETVVRAAHHAHAAG